MILGIVRFDVTETKMMEPETKISAHTIQGIRCFITNPVNMDIKKPIKHQRLV